MGSESDLLSCEVSSMNVLISTERYRPASKSYQSMVIRWHLVILPGLITIEHVKGFGGLVHVTLGKFDLAGADSAL